MKRAATAAVLALLLLCAGCSTDLENVPSTSPSMPQAELAATPSPTPQPTPSPTPMPTPEPLPLEGAVICVDPGHCVTPESGKGHRELMSPLSDETKPLYTTGTRGANMTEEQLNLTVGLQFRDALEELGAEVVMPREV